MATTAIGRSEELASTEGFLEQAEVRPTGLVLSGEEAAHRAVKDGAVGKVLIRVADEGDKAAGQHR